MAPDAIACESDVDLLDKARGGDPDGFGSLFRRYRSRLLPIATRYFAPGWDRDDLVQEVMIGFFKAVRDFRDDRGSFGAFADLCVRRQVITFVKTATRQKHALLNFASSIDKPMYEDSDETLATRLASPSDTDTETGDLADVSVFLQALWERCSELERGILSMYSQGYSFSEMAVELRVHWKSIDNAVWRVKVKARKLAREERFKRLGDRQTWKMKDVG